LGGVHENAHPAIASSVQRNQRFLKKLGRKANVAFWTGWPKSWGGRQWPPGRFSIGRRIAPRGAMRSAAFRN
jgi:hypothetical protein